MDTITHGIAGALIGKAVFRGQDLWASPPMNRGRMITWSLTLGAIFPDSEDRKSTRLNSSHSQISYAVFCLKKKKKKITIVIAEGLIISTIRVMDCTRVRYLIL